PLFIHRDSMGISGIVRAQSWEDAYGICEDEFFQDADESEEDFIAEYGVDFTEDAAWQESHGFRPNGGIYSRDLNDDRLDVLTPELLADLEIRLEIENPAAEDEHAGPFFSWHESRRLNGNGRPVFSMAGRHGTYSRVSPCFVSRLPHVFRNSHFSPNCDAHAIS
ncbi:MAG TPA: hypothetical protein VLB09_00620, partial [Nitrospiria bacterium]|nr:hypothetical protein [Nitrospiria bacterium]